MFLVGCRHSAGVLRARCTSLLLSLKANRYCSKVSCDSTRSKKWMCKPLNSRGFDCEHLQAVDDKNVYLYCECWFAGNISDYSGEVSRHTACESRITRSETDDWIHIKIFAHTAVKDVNRIKCLLQCTYFPNVLVLPSVFLVKVR